MISSETKIRVRYAETDKMSYVYHGNYIQYYEVGRVEFMRSLGSSYAEMEEKGVMMPILDVKIKYIKPAFYDNELIIKTFIKELPTAKITFYYEILNPMGEIINTGETTLAFVDINSQRPCRCPNWFYDALAKHLK